MNISKIFLFIVLSLFLGSPLSAETIYRDANGNKISYEEYQRLAARHTANFKSREKADVKARRKAEEKREREYMAKKRRRKNKQYEGVDYLGRPLKDAQGRWIRYPGDENPGTTTTGYGERVKEENANRRRLDRDKRAEFKWGRY